MFCKQLSFCFLVLCHSVTVSMCWYGICCSFMISLCFRLPNYAILSYHTDALLSIFWHPQIHNLETGFMWEGCDELFEFMLMLGIKLIILKIHVIIVKFRSLAVFFYSLGWEISMRNINARLRKLCCLAQQAFLYRHWAWDI